MEVRDFLANLTAVGGSPYAFAAYIAVVAAWVYTSVARHRLGKIARLLKDLPLDQRAEVILKEYSALPRSGLSAEQWIKSRQHLLLFIGFLSLVICLTIILVIALGLPQRPGDGSEKAAGSGAMMEILQVLSAKNNELERDKKALETKVADLTGKFASIGPGAANPLAIDLMRDLQQQFPSAEAAPVAPGLSAEDKATSTLLTQMKKLDDDILEQTSRIQALQNAQSAGQSIDVETMKLKRLIDKRSQMYDTLRQIIDKYNVTAKGIIDSMR